MKLIRQRSKSASVFLIALMVLLTLPYQSVLAAMIETDATLGITAQGQEARNTIKSILAREDIQAALIYAADVLANELTIYLETGT